MNDGASLDMAWKEAEAALPKGWHLTVGRVDALRSTTTRRGFVYWAGAGPVVEAPETMLGGKKTPAEALTELAARLRDSKS